ncbi:uncharacterized protein LOC109579623 [Bactrocera dorsalis]|uniref:Uncharacterized protein LOC109579623 n=1 Tax=Bactrocera dorsalis TaxID=27457 RepID=A0A6J0RLK2_BACDO|nr:uncharacterized protein LOC109579623 [Bactrocera dorsalis]
MNTILLLVCIATCTHLTLARPDVSLGYQYQPGYSSSGGGLLQTPHAPSSNYFSPVPTFSQNVGIGGSGGAGSGSGSFGFSGNSGGSSYSSGGYGALSGSFGGAGDFGGSTGVNDYQGGYNSGNIHYSHQSPNFVGRAPIVTKHFWLHSAPEDHDEQQIVRYINIGQPRKNYNVVFINTPSSSVNKAKIIANVAPVEDKTAIYVLAKKANALDVSAEVATPAPVVNKPEVFFIKYKTPEEAVHAQHTIQAQYDALGGSSNLSNEGSIPVSSAIGSLGGSIGSGDDHVEDSHIVHGGPSIAVSSSDSSNGAIQNYLPPNHK